MDHASTNTRAIRIVRLLDRNVDDLYADRKTHAEQGARNRILWDRAAALDIQEDVLAILRERMH
jgi:hypothetical protein